jgi:hypothetical protein
MANVYWPPAGFSTKWPPAGASTEWPSSSSGRTWPSSAAAFTPPAGFTALLGYSASNIDGSLNSTLTNLQLVSTWVNLGSLGAAGNLTGAGATRPQFVSSVAQLGNKPAMRGDGTKTISTGTFAAQVQPLNWYMVASTDLVGGIQLYFGTAASEEILWVSTSPGKLQLYAGSTVITGLTLQANKYHSITFSENGASSSGSLDGAGTGAISTGTNGASTLTVFSEDTHAVFLRGDIVELWLYAGTPGSTAPSVAQWNAAVSAYYGSTPL